MSEQRRRRRTPEHNYYVPGESDDEQPNQGTPDDDYDARRLKRMEARSQSNNTGRHTQRFKPAQGKNKKRMKKWQIVVIVLVAFVTISTLIDSLTLPDYQIVTQENNFARNGILGFSYRVIVDPSLSENQLKQVFKSVIKNDASTLHNVWFYSSQEAVDFGPCDIAQISDESGSLDISIVSEEQRQEYQAISAYY